MKVDWLIVGAGFTGAVLAERLASQADQKVLVVDRRDHIGGNAYDSYDEHGALVHRYGAHIFHTGSRKIWDYLSQFTAWRPYHHEVKGSVEGKLVPIPFNLNSLEQLFPRRMAERLERKLVDRYGFGVKVPILRMLEETDSGLKELAQYIYREVFERYTRKQWDLKPEELDASVTGRVPVFISRDDRYFQDTYQAIPRLGYTELFRRLLAHPNIHVLLKTDSHEVLNQISAKRIIFTGPIDEYFGFVHGALPYRSLRFEFRHEQVERFQPVAVINYPNDQEFTRIIEFRHFSGRWGGGTTIAYEYPEAHKPGANEPYYPVPREENREKYARYLREAQALAGRVYFAGRLADYKYYNMDQAVGRALKLFEEIAAAERPDKLARVNVA
jgi:UDP-galactopyranose mutase